MIILFYTFHEYINIFRALIDNPKMLEFC